VTLNDIKFHSCTVCLEYVCSLWVLFMTFSLIVWKKIMFLLLFKVRASIKMSCMFLNCIMDTVLNSSSMKISIFKPVWLAF